MTNLLSDQTAIVTGASSGNGRAIAKTFADEGAAVVCADIIDDPREKGYEDQSDLATHEMIEENGGDTVFVECDVTEREQVRAAVDTAVDEFGQLDIMVNNAGVFTRLVDITETTQEEWEKTIAVNLTGVWNGTKEAVEQLVEQDEGGSVINIASVGGLVGLEAEPAYSASKGGVVNFTRATALDCAPHEINVNAVCPGWISTAMTREYFEDPEFWEQLNEVTPWPRLGKPQDVADACTFLAGPRAEWITGHSLAVDGGYTAR
ncbi:short-chain dehydrogenase [halophilic archaeon]|nr:short-chain dehydrogenase [halophilic archaeon]